MRRFCLRAARDVDMIPLDHDGRYQCPECGDIVDVSDTRPSTWKDPPERVE